MPGKTSAAVVAKVKTKHGKMLKNEDYQKLFSCSSLSEVVSYLKSSTHYKEILSKISETTVHRGQLENILKQYVFYEFGTLCKYEFGAMSYFTTFIKRTYEVKEIIHFLTLLCAGKHGDYILSLPTYFNSHTDINLDALAEADNYDDFLVALDKTPYRAVLGKYKPEPNKYLNLSEIEDALYIFVYTEIFKVIEDTASAAEKKELFEIFYKIIDCENILRIIRMKKFYNMSGDDIMRFLLPFGKLKKSQLDAWAKMESSEEVVAAVGKTRYRRYIDEDFLDEEQDSFHRARYKICRKYLYFGETSSSVVIAFYYLLQNEILNVINIVEATRYSFDRKKLQNILIYS